MKKNLICPICSNNTISYSDFYSCPICDWDSKTETIDISYKDNLSAPLSNLFPHKFVIDGVECKSMESFIQSLRERDVQLQKSICSDYSGMMAYKMRLALNDWRKEGDVYWQGKTICRFSDEYTELISRAYNCLFEQNILFKTVLERFKKHHLIHSIGCDDISETLLTEHEYRYQLNRLKEKIK